MLTEINILFIILINEVVMEKNVLLKKMVEIYKITNTNFEDIKVKLYNSYKEITDDKNFLSNLRFNINEITKIDFENQIADKDGEMLMEYDEEGNALGLKSRKFFHNKKNLLWHKEVACLLLDEFGRIYVIQRSFDKKQYPNALGLLAGHVVGTETVQDAIQKEVGEETTSYYLPQSFIRICDPIPNVRDDNKCFVVPYICALKYCKDNISFQESEVSGALRLTLSQFKKVIKRQDSEESIFKDNNYYNKLCECLEKLYELENWYMLLQKSDIHSIHKHLGLTTTNEEIAFFTSLEN